MLILTKIKLVINILLNKLLNPHKVIRNKVKINVFVQICHWKESKFWKYMKLYDFLGKN